MARVGVEGRYLEGDDLRALLGQDFWTVGVSGPAHRIDPAAFVRGLALLAGARGARVHERSPVRSVRRGERTVLRLPRGQVSCATAVLAANAWTPRLGFLRGRVFPVHTCAVATEPLGEAMASVGWRGRQIVFEVLTGTGHTFYLTLDDRLVCRGLLRYHFAGGLRPPDLARAQTRLAATVAERFPPLASVPISHRWSGPLDMTRSLYPAIGSLEGTGRVLHAVGYCGHGLAVASLAGRLMAELHDGERSPELDYALRHSPPPKMPPEPLRWLATTGVTRGLVRRSG